MLTVSREDFEDANKYIVMASRRGFIKKSELALFKNLRRVGLRALVIEEDDDLIGAAVASNGDELLLSTKLGMACRFDQNDDQVRPMGRTARGVTGMRFKLDGDEVVSLEVISEPTFDEAQFEDLDDTAADLPEAVEEDAAGEDAAGIGPEVLVVTDGGMGKRSFVSTYRKTNRGARGVVNIRLREGENVLTVIQITESDELLLTTERGQISRIPASEIRRVGRASLGVRIMNLNPNDRITGVAKLIKIAEESGADQNNSAEDPADGVEIPIETVVVPTVPETGADTAEVNGGEEPEA
jgi:DNA gyrase subunit A